MGKRSTTTTKSGKFMNPTDQARKELRKRELKKNKKQRQLVRASVLRNKSIEEILEELRGLDQMEFDPNSQPAINEKVIKEKRRKLHETIERVLRLLKKEDPGRYEEIRNFVTEYEKSRSEQIAHYEAVRQAQTVSLDEIPLPPSSSTMIPGLPRGILVERKGVAKPPGPPPGFPSNKKPITLEEKRANILKYHDKSRKKTVGFAMSRAEVAANEIPISIPPPQVPKIPMPPQQPRQPAPIIMRFPQATPGRPVPGAIHTSVFSAPPNLIERSEEVISQTPIYKAAAKPRINNAMKAAATKFIPTALKVKRDQHGHKVRSINEVVSAAAIANIEKSNISDSFKTQNLRQAAYASKDEIYEQFMKEMGDLM